MTKAAQTFVYRHRFLHMLWSADLHRPFYTLTFNQQRVVHDYYRPAENLTDDQLLEHRFQVRKQWPGLSQKAGKAFRRIEQIYLEAMRVADGDEKVFNAYLRHKAVRTSTGKPDKRGQRISVSALVRPTFDARAVAKAIIQVANDMVLEDLKKNDPKKAAALEAARRTLQPAAPSVDTDDPHRTLQQLSSAKPQRRRAPQQQQLDLDSVSGPDADAPAPRLGGDG